MTTTPKLHDDDVTSRIAGFAEGTKVLCGMGRKVHASAGRGSWTWASVTKCGKRWTDLAADEAPVDCVACKRSM